MDAWETTYLHLLPGHRSGAGLVPGQRAAPGARRAAGQEAAAGFLAEYGERVREAYPAAPYGTVLPFRRVFVVARKR